MSCPPPWRSLGSQQLSPMCEPSVSLQSDENVLGDVCFPADLPALQCEQFLRVPFHFHLPLWGSVGPSLPAALLITCGPSAVYPDTAAEQLSARRVGKWSSTPCRVLLMEDKLVQHFRWAPFGDSVSCR